VSLPASPSRPGLTLLAVIAVLAAWRLGTIAYYDHGMFVDEAQYVDWARHPAFGYYSKPPALAWSIAGARAVCGEAALCVRGLAVLLYSLAAVCIFFAGRTLFGAAAGLAAAILFLLLPGIGLTGLFITTDAPLALCTAGAVLCMAQALKRGRWGWWIALGVCFGLGMLSKYSFALMIAGFLAYVVLTPARRPLLRDARLWACLLVGAALTLPNLIWNAQHGFATVSHTADISGLDEPGLKPLRLLEYLGQQLLVFGPLTFAALLALPWLRGDVLKSDGGRLLGILALTMFGAFAVLALLSRTLLNWAYVAFPAAIVLVAAALVQGGYRRWLRWSLIVSVVMIVLGAHLPTFARLAGIELKRGQDPYSRTMGWRELGSGVSAAWARYPGTRLLGDDRWVIAEMLYYVRPIPHDAAMWNPAGPITDHYRLTRDAGALASADFLFVTLRPDIPDVAGYFASAEQVAQLPITTHRDSTKTYYLYLLRGFKGYANAAR
jgi:4-amino-4-deoxy-L-arabinose transferase-like glycosyltransferase